MHVFIIAAITNDGFIAQTTQQKSTRWTSKEDYHFFTARTKQAGVVIMGSTTYATIGHPLKDRLNIVYTKHLQTSPHPQLRYTNLPPQELIASLENEGFTEAAICGGASIYTLFLKSGLVNTLYLTVHTHITFGRGIPLFTESFILPPPIKTTPLSATTILNEYSLDQKPIEFMQESKN